jgi:cytochrome c-type biogenesis protein CcmH/NrfG
MTKYRALRKLGTVALLLSSNLLANWSTPAEAAAIQSTPQANAQSPEFAEGKKAVDEKRWQAAIEALEPFIRKQPNNADAHNLLAYAYRWQNRLDEAFKSYQAALRIDARHLGANEYLGQLYLKMNDKAKAHGQLAILRGICPSGCKEADDLASAIASAP